MITRLISGLLALALLLAGWQWRQAVTARADLALYRGKVAEQIQQAEAAARSEEQRRTAKIQEAQDAAHQARIAAESDARAARASADRLRQRAAELAASCSASNPAPAASSPAASAPGPVLADMLIRLEEAGREIAEESDRRRIAGIACERVYRALSND